MQRESYILRTTDPPLTRRTLDGSPLGAQSRGTPVTTDRLTVEPTLPPLVGDPAPRGDALGPVCNILLDVIEELHGMEGTAWWDAPYTLDEREMTCRAVRSVIQMMKTYGRTRDPFVEAL